MLKGQAQDSGAGGLLPEWDVSMKDRFVGIAFSVDLCPHIRVAGLFGILLLTAAAFMRDFLAPSDWQRHAVTSVSRSIN